VCDEGLAKLLNRLADMSPAPLAPPLKDAVVHRWGNPWLQLNAMRWGRVSQEARALVTEWLKLEFIEAFFTLLAEEKTGDSRRLEFWKRYVDSIEEIHFALGKGARQSNSTDFVTLRKKMQGLIVPLEDNNKSNNAFIMRLGSLVVVEFSGYSNACYGYQAADTHPFRLDRPVVTPVDHKNSLKRSDKALWLQHQDGIHGYAKWEARFVDELARFGIHPKKAGHRAPKSYASSQPPTSHDKKATPVRTPPPNLDKKPIAARESALDKDMTLWRTWKEIPFSHSELQKFAAQVELIVADFTASSGYLWVRTDDANPAVNNILRKWGFKFENAQRGWWRT
jgi:hypothetical protein